MIIRLFLNISSAALFVFFTASAGTRVIPADLLFLADGSGLSLLQEQTLSRLFIIDVIPLGQLIEPVRPCVHHILIQLLLVEGQADLCILLHGLDRIRLLQAVIDAVQKTDHGHNIHVIFFSQFPDRPLYFRVRIGQKLFINALFHLKIRIPQAF